MFSKLFSVALIGATTYAVPVLEANSLAQVSAEQDMVTCNCGIHFDVEGNAYNDAGEQLCTEDFQDPNNEWGITSTPCGDNTCWQWDGVCCASKLQILLAVLGCRLGDEEELYETFKLDIITSIDFTGYKGPKGESGPRGPSGAEGNPGPKGDTGSQGPRGPAGAEGTAGTDGDQGTQGPDGFQGPDGNPGPKGNNGAPGNAGVQGTQGDQGPMGNVGVRGNDGAEGPAGTDGDKGAAGDQGPAGQNGQRGNRGNTGPRGNTGAQGEPGDSGVQALLACRDRQ